MGRSNSCFKIITCGSDSADNDDLDISENKDSNDKRGWSFRKRSARHRVLSNSVITETPSSVKESLESADVNFQPLNISNVPEKIPTIPCSNEKPQLPTPVEQEASETIIETDAESKDDSPLDEFIVIVIQTAVRRFLAQRELLKLKNVVKLQAAVRGHLVRRHAVGTLRCVQAIVKMQALVRARRACLEKEPDWKDEKDTCNSTTSKGNSVAKPNASHTSIQNLLGNRFARQLMESTPKNKHIHFKCDPAKQDSAWNWLERWMSVSAAKQTPEPEPKIENPENEKNDNFASPVETNIPSEVLCDSADSTSSIKETDVPSEIEENLITSDADKFNFQQSQPSPSLRDDLELFQPENNSASDVNEISIEIDSHKTQIMQSDTSPQQELKPLPNMPEMESEPLKGSLKSFASEDLETEEKKFVFGSRKASNAAFIAAQSKFEELTSSANSGKSVSSQHQDASVDSNADTISSGKDTLTKTKYFNVSENPVSRIQYGGSECGTELSISSTLDSPDRSEVGTTEYDNEAKVSEKEICDPKNSNNLDVKSNDASTFTVCDVFHSIMDQPEKVDAVHSESVNSVVVIDAPEEEHKPDSNVSGFHKEPNSETGRQTYRLSPEASPRSHMTIPESQGTPSSQVSLKTKNNRADKSGSNRKRKPLSASKGSPSNPNHDSGARNSTEQLPKDQKNGKRRSSFGASRTDNIDQEPGDNNSSSSSLPHFMLATESARAKLQANNSPRSSPDVQDRDIYIKKRHSLPVGNGRQGSPHIQRSLSQAQQGAKVNGTPHEKKWQR